MGEVFNDRYKIIRELGKGGMAIVFEAQDLILDRKVALKMLRPEYVNDKDFVKKFRHEAKAVARLTHPNVVNIYDIGQEEGKHYLVMEDIEGRNLKDIIKEKGKLPVLDALNIAKQISAALIVAHDNNIIHCDIKPHNILITPAKKVKVTDFGIARAVTSSTVTMTDTIVGSAHYFSPEQARGGEIKTHSDLYSLGVVLYEMLTGEVPFKGDSPISVALKHIQEQPKKPSLINSKIPTKVENLVMKAIAKEPEARFSTAEEMQKEIKRVMKITSNKGLYKSYKESDEGDTKVLHKSDIEERQKRLQQEREYLTYKGERKNIPTWLKWTLVTIGLLALLSIGGIIFYQNYMDVPIVEVPDVVGTDLKEAEKRASEVGLQFVTQNEGVHHPDIPEGSIISQYPVGGERVRQTRKVMITISKGPAIIKSPDLTGMTIREAEVLLDNQNLKFGKREFTYNENVAEGIIISQSPEPETEIGVDALINIIISQGPQPVMIVMPNLFGLDKQTALARLISRGLQAGKLDEELTRRFKAGQISNQEYTPGTEIPENSKVNLTVSQGLINTENAEIQSVLVRINSVSAGPQEQRIKIIVFDNNGRDVVYDRVHSPGDRITQSVNSVGPTTIEVYSDQELLEKYKIGY